MDRSAGPTDVGAKASRLIELLAAGFAVPPLVALGVEPEPDTEVVARVRAILGTGPVAVRSSAVAEDLDDASFAGVYDTVLDVIGDDALVEAIAAVRASVAGARVEAYDPTAAGGAIGVIVQRMVDATVGGVAYSHGPDPVSTPHGAESATVVAVAGSPAPLVDGTVDGYAWTATRDGVVTGADHGGAPMGRDAVREVALLAVAVATHQRCPQEIEWAYDRERLWLLQARPVTSSRRALRAAASPAGRGGQVVVSGVAASPGVARGTVRVVAEVDQLDALQPGDVLVAPTTEPAWTPAFRVAVAVVTDTGSIAAHAAVVAREFGIPAVVGTGDATERLADGDDVIVDGTTGEVRRG